MEARVGLSSSAGKGLIEEAKNIEANYLVVGNKRKNQKNRLANNSFIKLMLTLISRNLHISFTRVPKRISKYCCDHVPDSCSLVLLRGTERLKQRLPSNSVHNQG